MNRIKNNNKNHTKIARYIVIVLLVSLFLASLFFAYISYKAEPGISVGVVFPSVFFLLLLAVSVSASVLKDILKKFYLPFMIIFYGGASFFVLTFIIFCITVMSFSGHDSLKNDTGTVIVLGCHTFGMTPGKTLKSRLDACYDALNAYDGDNKLIIVVTGGQGKDESIPEGDSMKAYLVNKGIDRDMIIAETESHSTFDNLLFSKEFIVKNGEEMGSVAIISSEFHVPRAVMIAKRLGYGDIFTDVYSIAAPSPSDTFGAGIMREYFAFVKSFIFDKVK